MVPNQIHDVGKLIREAVAAGWGLVAVDETRIAFCRGEQVTVIGQTVANWETLAEHRRALGLPEHKSAEAK